MTDTIKIKHLENPNITTFVDGKQINIRNHEATVDIETAKKLMEGPWGYELIGVYDDFLKYVSQIPLHFEGFVDSNSKPHKGINVLLGVPLSGQKIYSWDKFTESLLNLQEKDKIHICFTIDQKEGEVVEKIMKWSDENCKHFQSIIMFSWDHDEVKAWNRVFKITVGRQTIFNIAKNMPNITHVWFVDSDVIHKQDALTKLLAHKRDAVSGLYYFKSVVAGGPVVFNAQGDKEFPFKCLGQQLVDTKPDTGLVECDWTGAGSLLLSNRIFRKYDFDWSKWIQRHGEDAWICMQAQRETGEKHICDTSVYAVHLDENGKEWGYGS